MAVIFDRPHEEDLPEILELIKVFGNHYGGDAGDPGTRAVMELYVRGERKGAVIARAAGRLVGFILYDFTPLFAPGNMHGRGDMMVVHPEYQRQGIARELLARMWQDGAERGARIFFNKSSAPAMIDYFRRQPDMRERGIYFFKTLVPVGGHSR